MSLVNLYTVAVLFFHPLPADVQLCFNYGNSLQLALRANHYFYNRSKRMANYAEIHRFHSIYSFFQSICELI